MHVYHYAAYEKTALRNLSLAHQAGEDTVDGWLREGAPGGPLRHGAALAADLRGVLLHQETRAAVHGRQPALRGRQGRRRVRGGLRGLLRRARRRAPRPRQPPSLPPSPTTTSTTASPRCACVTGCWTSQRQADPGRFRRQHGEGSRIRSPCDPAMPARGRRDAREPTPEEGRLHEYLAGLPDNRPWTDDERAVAMVAAATGYHRRERKQFWWQHFDRVEAPSWRAGPISATCSSWSRPRSSDWALAKPRERMRTRC